MDLTLTGIILPADEIIDASVIHVILMSAYPDWLEKQPIISGQWLATSGFKPAHGAFRLMPDDENVLRVLVTLDHLDDLWALGDLPFQLPEGTYRLEGLETPILMRLALGWGLGAYQFLRYKKSNRDPAQLVIDDKAVYAAISHEITAVTWVRNLINTPAEDMGPAQLASATRELSIEFDAAFEVVVGDRLLTDGYPAIHTVGRASIHPPRLIDMRWGRENDPEVVLVGKGVSFDTGGLDLKNASGMRQMKKDMGGAAHVMGLARMIMSKNLPVRLRVLIPAVENAVSGAAFRPGDIIKTRKGLTVEVDNTDAEGRLVLCDALAEASASTPSLIIDFATLTGAARVALGTELPAFFTRSDEMALALTQAGQQTQDLLWRLPLYEDYRQQLNSSLADLLNCSNSPYGGAITAALFLETFVPHAIDWLHLDLMAWNLRARPGRPCGGEAMGLRAVFTYLKSRFGSEDV